MSIRLAMAAAAAMGVQVGAAMVATRLVVHQAGPATLALLRYAIGAACLVPAFGPLLWRGGLRGRDAVVVCLLGIAQFGLLIAVLNAGLARLPAGLAALLFASFPLMTLLIAAAIGQERLTAGKLGGVALTVIGVGLATGGPGGAADPLGIALVLGAALIGAVCSVLYRPYLRRHPAGPVSLAAMLAAVAALAAYAVPAEALLTAPPSFDALGWAAVLFIGIGSGAAYFLLLWALKHGPASLVTAFLALGPVTAMALEAASAGAWPGTGPLAGLVCVGLGLVLAAQESAG